MKANPAWKKNNLREIKNTLARYLAILAITAIGVGFFCGLKVAKKAMLNSGNDYVSESNMYDFRMLSSLGLTEEDAEYIEGLDGVEYAQGAVSTDIIVHSDSLDRMLETSRCVLTAKSITQDINKLKIIEGRMPRNDDECVVDALVFGADAIGDYVVVSSDNAEETLDYFKYDKYKIVGTCTSVYYLNIERGTTNLENGTVTGFVYIPYSGFNAELYSELFVTLDSKFDIFSNEYNELIEAYSNELANALESRADLRYEEIIIEANSAISDSQSEYDKEYADYLEERENAVNKLLEAKNELDLAKEAIALGKDEIADGEKRLKSARKKYKEGLAEYNAGFEAFSSIKAETEAQLQSAQSQIDENRMRVEVALEIIEETGVIDKYNDLLVQIADLEARLELIEDHASVEYIELYVRLMYLRVQLETLEEYGVIDEYDKLMAAAEQIEQAQAQLDAQRAEAEAEFANTQAELDAAKERLDKAKRQISSSEKQLDEAKAELEQAQADYEMGLSEYRRAKTNAESGFKQAEAEFADARKQIEDARDKVAELSENKSFMFKRDTNTGFMCFENDSSVVEGIASVLPIFFFLVAALVCTTTMARMVDEQRTQIGTLKAIGYGNGAIIGKYSAYSGSAAMLGCALGYFGGSFLFPYSIWQAYKLLYNFGELSYTLDPLLAVFSVIVSLLCSVGATYVACRSELTLMPAQLMRPKAPKSGKSVILERIPIIWNRFGFLQKVSLRNIFRYKKRLFMMVLGVGGCTALVLTGFGVQDSIANIADDQFGRIMKYDYTINFARPYDEEDIDEFVESTSSVLTECVFICMDTFKAVSDNGAWTVNVVATDDLAITDLISFELKGNGVEYPPYGSIIINEKLAHSAGVSPGEKIRIKLSDTEYVDAQVAGIFENYAYNYIYMTGRTYTDLFNKELKYKSAVATTDEDDIYSLSTRLTNEFGASSVMIAAEVRDRVDGMMNSLNSIVVLVIFSACALAFVVSYNLSNINITERIREIATIKVLGFYQKETSAYVFRENFVLTFAGILIGLPAGYALHRFVMNEVQIDMVSFMIKILPQSYLFSIVITFAIAVIVDLLLRRKINAINMAESLKSVE